MERFAEESIWREGGVLTSFKRFSYHVTLLPFLSNLDLERAGNLYDLIRVSAHFSG
jgi:hypothetical protein